MIRVFGALTLLDGLLLWAIVATGRRYWAAKLVTIFVVLGFNFLVWASLGTFSGWGSRAQLPARSLVAQCLVVEPDQATHLKGAVYWWLIPESQQRSALGYNSAPAEPRAYSQPYSRDEHVACLQAQNAAKGSGGQMATLNRRHAPDAGHKGSSGRKIPKWAYRAYIEPAVHLPPKGSPS